MSKRKLPQRAAETLNGGISLGRKPGAVAKMALQRAGNDTGGSGQGGDAGAARLQCGAEVKPRSELLDPGIQRGDDRIERTLAFVVNGCSQKPGQSSERCIRRIGIERPASNPEHPAVKAALARLPSEAWRQMKRFPDDRRVAVPPIMRAPAHQGEFGKR
jgi:hypothetical protein